MTVYGRGTECLGADWEAIAGYINKGVDTLTKVAQAGKALIGPTQKAQTSYITGSTVGGTVVQPYGTPAKAAFPILPVAMGAGVLLLVAVFMLKR